MGCRFLQRHYLLRVSLEIIAFVTFNCNVSLKIYYIFNASAIKCRL